MFALAFGAFHRGYLCGDKNKIEDASPNASDASFRRAQAEIKRGKRFRLDARRPRSQVAARPANTFNGSDCIKKNRQAAPTNKQDFSRIRESREEKQEN